MIEQKNSPGIPKIATALLSLRELALQMPKEQQEFHLGMVQMLAQLWGYVSAGELFKDAE